MMNVHQYCPNSAGKCREGLEAECAATQEAWEDYGRWLEELDQRARKEAEEDYNRSYLTSNRDTAEEGSGYPRTEGAGQV